MERARGDKQHREVQRLPCGRVVAHHAEERHNIIVLEAPHELALLHELAQVRAALIWIQRPAKSSHGRSVGTQQVQALEGARLAPVLAAPDLAERTAADDALWAFLDLDVAARDDVLGQLLRLH